MSLNERIDTWGFPQVHFGFQSPGNGRHARPVNAGAPAAYERGATWGHVVPGRDRDESACCQWRHTRSRREPLSRRGVTRDAVATSLAGSARYRPRLGCRLPRWESPATRRRSGRRWHELTARERGRGAPRVGCVPRRRHGRTARGGAHHLGTGPGWRALAALARRGRCRPFAPRTRRSADRSRP
jgi:hypothetical protein